MRNILMTACYQVDNLNYGNQKTEDFKEIHQLCVRSFCKNLRGLDEHVALTGKANTHHGMIYNIFYRILEFQQNERCNILFVDADTLCIKPTDIFGKYDEFHMFLATPDDMFHDAYPKRVSRKLYQGLRPWFMSNVRYYPSDLNGNVLGVGCQLMLNYLNVWAYECIVWNAMLHSQCRGMSYGDIKTKYHKPELNYQYQIKGFTNDIPLEQARIVHFASSRDSGKALDKMRNWKI